MAAWRLVLFVLAPVLASCGGSNAQLSVGGGNNYSTGSCADNCGKDVQCLANCQEVNNSIPLPVGAQPAH